MWISLKAVMFDYFSFFVYYVPTDTLNKRLSAILRWTDSKAVIKQTLGMSNSKYIQIQEKSWAKSEHDE